MAGILSNLHVPAIAFYKAMEQNYGHGRNDYDDYYDEYDSYDRWVDDDRRMSCDTMSSPDTTLGTKSGTVTGTETERGTGTRNSGSGGDP